MGYFLDRCMYLIFLLVRADNTVSAAEYTLITSQARVLGSYHHCVSSWKASMAFCYVALAPLELLYAHLALAKSPTSSVQPERLGDSAASPDWQPLRFGARCAPSGREYVGVDIILPPSSDDDEGKATRPRDWWDEGLATALVDRCEKLRLTLRETHGIPS